MIEDDVKYPNFTAVGHWTLIKRCADSDTGDFYDQVNPAWYREMMGYNVHLIAGSN